MVVSSHAEAIERLREWADTGKTMSNRAAWGLVLILAFCNALSFVDRQLIVLLAEPIRKELGLNDTQLGLLQGTVFAFTYAFLAIPCAALADRAGRDAAAGDGAAAGIAGDGALTPIAERRLATTLAALSGYGISATGRVAEGRAVYAVADKDRKSVV